jgi:hypothetical protein
VRQGSKKGVLRCKVNKLSEDVICKNLYAGCAFVQSATCEQHSPAGLSGMQVATIDVCADSQCVMEEAPVGPVDLQGCDMSSVVVSAGVELSSAMCEERGVFEMDTTCVLGEKTSLWELENPCSALSSSIEIWRAELELDFNREYILDGIEFGFMIIDQPCSMVNTCSRNYKSVLQDVEGKVEAQILKEVKLGRYIIVSSPPDIVSSLGAVPKKGSTKIRVIHDFSRPDGGLNQFCKNTSVKYSTLDSALNHVSSGAFLSKVDLSEAYRSVPINPYCYNLTGLHWTFSGHAETTYLFDARLPFGSAMSCRIFQSLSDAVVRIMERKGHVVCSYIDDFMVIADNKLDCEAGLNCLVELLENLVFLINWHKVAFPAQIMTFLGIEINCMTRTLSLPASKVAEVKSLLVSWSLKKKCTKHELQVLIGKLNWCAKVVRGGRTFMRNLINLLPLVHEPYHYVRLSSGAKSDIEWWLVGLSKFHGSTPFLCDIPPPISSFATDACMQGGAGHFGGDWFFVSWDADFPQLKDTNINVLELQSVLVAARRWCKTWKGCHIQVKSDNMATIAAINNTTSRSSPLLKIIKELFWLSVEYDFRLSAVHLPGRFNLFSDKLSRMHNVYDANYAMFLLTGGRMGSVCINNHMSYESFFSLQIEWRAALLS